MYMNSAAGIRPAVLAKDLEERGFESMWVPEHTHIPTSRISPHPSINPLPEGYKHMMNPFVSLAAASAVMLITMLHFSGKPVEPIPTYMRLILLTI